jgi:hypothetical protein
MPSHYLWADCSALFMWVWRFWVPQEGDGCVAPVFGVCLGVAESFFFTLDCACGDMLKLPKYSHAKKGIN